MKTDTYRRLNIGAMIVSLIAGCLTIYVALRNLRKEEAAKKQSNETITNKT